MTAWISAHRPALLLALLSPGIAELLTGSTPVTGLVVAPLSFAVSFALLMCFYGGGALLIREAAIRWNKGWASILLLGAAYGVVEEGLAVHTFFQPGGAPVFGLGAYGRVGGVDVLWAVGLTLFHAVYSIALPILLVRLAYPETEHRPFLGRRGPWLVGVGYVVTVALFAASTPNFPSIGLFLATVAVVVALVLAARWTPREMLRARSGPPRARPRTFAIAGASFMTGWLVFGIAAPGWIPWPAVAVGALLGLSAVLLGFVRSAAGSVGNSSAKYWFPVGLVGFFVPWDVILDLGAVPGILAVTALMVAFLYWLRGRSQRSVGTGAGRASAAGSG